MAIRPFHFGSMNSFQVFGSASFETSRVLNIGAIPVARIATHPAFWSKKPSR